MGSNWVALIRISIGQPSDNLVTKFTKNNNNMYSKAEVESRTQGSRTQGSRPRAQKNPKPRPTTALSRTDPLEAKNRNAQGQGPRTQAQKLSKKKGPQNFFSDDLRKNTSFKKCFRRSTNFTTSKNTAVLEPRTGQFSRT